jgi:hypothetical protein
MKKLLAGLALGLAAPLSFAQSVLTFDVVFDTVYEASGAFTPNVKKIVEGPFCDAAPGDADGVCTIPTVNLTGTVTLTAVASGTQLVGTNTIALNGSFSTQSGGSPSNGWSVHTFNNAVFDLRGNSNASYFATDFVSDPTNWPIFAATASNGLLSDHGPASIYGGSCPYFFGCLSAQSAGSPNGTQPFDLFDVGTPVFSGTAVFAPGFRNTGNHALLSGTATSSNPGSGLGFDNGMDAFSLQGVLDTANTQGNGTSQLYPDGVNGFPGIVRIATFSNTGNTVYIVEGKVNYGVVPAPPAVWLLASGVAFLGGRRWLKGRPATA